MNYQRVPALGERIGTIRNNNVTSEVVNINQNNFNLVNATPLRLIERSLIDRLPEYRNIQLENRPRNFQDLQNPPPLQRFIVEIGIPANAALQNVLPKVLYRLLVYFYQQIIGQPIAFNRINIETDAQDNMLTQYLPQPPQPEVWSSVYVWGENNNRNMFFPFAAYQSIIDFFNVIVANYGNEGVQAEDQIDREWMLGVDVMYIEMSIVVPREVLNERPGVIGMFEDEFLPENFENIQMRQHNIRNIRPPRNDNAANVGDIIPQEIRRSNRNLRPRIFLNPATGQNYPIRGGRVNYRQGRGSGRGMPAGGYELLRNNEEIRYFHKAEAIGNAFLNSSCIRKIPYRDERNCILMAFMSSQCLKYDFNDQKKVVFLNPSLGPTNLIPRNGEVTRYPASQYLSEKLNETARNNVYPFLFCHEIEGLENWSIRLFNTFKPDNNSYDEDTENVWSLVADEIGNLVRVDYASTHTVEEASSLNLEDIGTVCELLANLFDVFIYIYDVEYKAGRVATFAPMNLTPSQYLDQERSIKIVPLLYDNGHMHAIIDYHRFMAKDNVNSYRPYQICPFCERKGNRTFRNEVEFNTHLDDKECLNSLETFFFEDHEKEIIEQATIPVVLRYDYKSKKKTLQCTRCKEDIQFNHNLMKHVCVAKMRCTDNDEILDKSKIFVYDLETCQQLVSHNQYYHSENCVCSMLAYYDEPEFFDHPMKTCRVDPDIFSFLDYIFANENQKYFSNSVWIAHNGGAFDVLVIMKYLNRKRRDYTWTPRPGSMHKFLCVRDTETGISFLDFLMFMPGSLDNIARSMGIEVSKGTFPHKFNNGLHDKYEGPVPSFDDENDWWSTKWVKSYSHLRSLREHYDDLISQYCNCPSFEEHNCNKPLWNFQEQLQEYCKLDVIVLAKCVASYRDNVLEIANYDSRDPNWKPKKVDPFKYMTTPQLAQAILLKGFTEESCFKLASPEKKLRIGQTREAIVWLQSLPNKNTILHRLNWHREFFCVAAQQYADGYCQKSRVAYVLLDCDLYACKDCHENTEKWNQPHFYFKTKTYEQVYYDINLLIRKKWMQAPCHLVSNTLFESQCSIRRKHGNNYNSIDLDEYRYYAYQPNFNFQECFKGGRTEVFKPYVNGPLIEERTGKCLYYQDVCSMYPAVCAKKPIPNGVPNYILGEEIDLVKFYYTLTISDEEYETHVNEVVEKDSIYWGYVYCKVVPNPNDYIGLLPNKYVPAGHPSSTPPRLVFSLKTQIGVWSTEEIRLAFKSGYHIETIFSMVYWLAGHRSNQILKPYVDTFIRLKQEAEGWKKLGASSENPTEDEKHRIAQELFVNNGNLGLIDITKVKIDNIGRLVKKLFLNSIYGKFGQQDISTRMSLIYGSQQFYDLWSSNKINRSGCTFLETFPGSGIYKAMISYQSEFLSNAGRSNFFIAAAITAASRCILHRQMQVIGSQNLVYCDTDSIIFTRDPNLPSLTKKGLGNWEEEKGGKIKFFMSLAPKVYFIEREGQENLDMKSKGILLNQENKNKLTKRSIQELMSNTLSPREDKSKFIRLQDMKIHSNIYNHTMNIGTLLTTYGSKDLRMNITKRRVVVSEENQDKIKNNLWEQIDLIDTEPLR